MSPANYHAAVERAKEEACKDKARLDFLDKRGNGQLWIARRSLLGRGYRLHNFTDGEFTDGAPTVREAIDKAMEKEGA